LLGEEPANFELCAEVGDESDREVQAFQVLQALGTVFRDDRVHRLDLNDYRALDETKSATYAPTTLPR